MTATQDAPVLGRKGLSLLQRSNQEPIRTAAPKGQPYLLLGTTSNYSWLYNDSGSGAHKSAQQIRQAAGPRLDPVAPMKVLNPGSADHIAEMLDKAKGC